MLYCNVIFFTLLLLVGSTSTAIAHPHSFIAMTTSPVVKGDQLTGLSMIWTMDEITSADLLYDAGSAKPDSVIWKKLAAEVMANVLGQHYFSEFWHQDKPIKFDNLPPEYCLYRQGAKAVLSFIMPLARPQPLVGQKYKFLTFDPTYFVDMFYNSPDDLRLPDTLKNRCRFDLHTPEVNSALKNYALALDKADAPQADRDLGRQFAQTVTLTCR